MKAINTKFGTIYIEEWAYDHHKPWQREEEDRVKIFDSNENYLDYLSAELVKENAEYEHIIPQELLDNHANKLANAQSLDDLLEMLDIEYEFVTTDIEALVVYFGEAHDSDSEPPTKDEVLNNEWVNRIGNHYIVVCEY